MSSLPPLDQVNRTKAFTPEQYEELKKLPSAQRLAYMRREAHKMSQADINKHYRNENYPEFRYHSYSGGGVGSPTPPHMRGKSHE